MFEGGSLIYEAFTFLTEAAHVILEPQFGGSEVKFFLVQSIRSINLVLHVHELAFELIAFSFCLCGRYLKRVHVEIGFGQLIL